MRPFYDLIANIAAEEYGHVEAVGATITSMLTGADAREIVANGAPAHFLKAGKGVLPVDSGGAPWTGDYVAYARVLELLTGADLTKTFPMPRIPTDRIPECRGPTSSVART